MKKTYFLCLVTFQFFFNIEMDGQHIQRSILFEYGQYFLENELGNPQQIEDDHISFQNFQPLLSINQVENISIDKNRFNALNIFSIYKSNHEEDENYIWSLCKNKNESILLTDKRLLDLQNKKLINTDASINPRLINYHHFSTSYDYNIMRWGSTMSNEIFPVTEDQGYVGDLLIYNYILSERQNNVLSTRFAIKYGLQLSNIEQWVDAEGHRLFESIQSPFVHNICALGRADNTALNQKQSQQQLYDGNLSFYADNISTNNDKNLAVLNDNSYLLISDNNASSLFKKSHGSLAMDRIWQLRSIDFTNEISLSLDAPILLSQMDDQDLYIKICIDSISHLDQCNYIKMETDDEQFILNQQRLLNSTDQRYFTFLSSQGLAVDLQLKEGSCNSLTSSTLDLNIYEGTPPFKLKYRVKGTDTYSYLSTDERFIKIDLQDFGQYELVIKDSKNDNYQTVINILSSEITDLNLQDTYILTNGIALDFNFNENVTITNPNGDLYTSQQQYIDQPGQYLFSITNSECSISKKVNIVAEDNILSSFSVYPNPTLGPFESHIEFHEAQVFQMSMKDISGQTLWTKSFE